jgi:hypothetical protein
MSRMFRSVAAESSVMAAAALLSSSASFGAKDSTSFANFGSMVRASCDQRLADSCPDDRGNDLFDHSDAGRDSGHLRHHQRVEPAARERRLPAAAANPAVLIIVCEQCDARTHKRKLSQRLWCARPAALPMTE